MKSKVPEKDENDVLKQINKHHKGTKEKVTFLFHQLLDLF